MTHFAIGSHLKVARLGYSHHGGCTLVMVWSFTMLACVKGSNLPLWK